MPANEISIRHSGAGGHDESLPFVMPDLFRHPVEYCVAGGDPL